MGLTHKKEKQLMKMPRIESRLSRSKDGRFLIHRTILTYIRPVGYYEAVLANNVKVKEENIVEDDKPFNSFLEQQGIELVE
jgi:hypothetical protein